MRSMDDACPHCLGSGREIRKISGRRSWALSIATYDAERQCQHCNGTGKRALWAPSVQGEDCHDVSD
jgi:DnaJ-class molecular chaperone